MASPVRSFGSFKGQKNFTGEYWAATSRTQVGYESWVERDAAMALDFDPAVVPRHLAEDIGLACRTVENVRWTAGAILIDLSTWILISVSSPRLRTGQLPEIRRLSCTRFGLSTLGSVTTMGVSVDLRRSWSQMPSASRKVCAAMFPLGLLLVMVGVLGDLAGWWGDFAFATNVLSSLAGVLLGVPFALLFIDQLTVARTELTEQRAASQRAALAADGLGEAVALALREEHQQSASEHLQRLVATTMAAHQVLKTQRRRLGDELCQFVEDPDPFMVLSFEAGLVSRGVVERAEERYLASEPDLSSIINAVVTEFDKCDNELRSAIFPASEEVWRRWHEHVEFEWQALERDNRPRLQAAGLQWLPLGRVASVRAALKGIGDTRFIVAIDSTDWSDGAVWEERLVAGQVYRTFDQLLAIVADARDWAENVASLVENAEWAAGFFRQQTPENV
ncbi:hypothetical protein [Streptomyces lunaelactis]|uniref:hypothetical protein n=1 Tax=Streptomyces lunaelactis TaxID=1535768 RepID=UPI0015853B84|nr:hypothetical protein [Streptomyces lunaelactis]NUK84516.1 hypothetical protein [Streptomyces lunaelactis]